MSRVKSFSKRRLLYLGEISELPQWVSSSAHSTLLPLLTDSQVGAFTLENPSADEVRHLESIARKSDGMAAVFSAGGSDFCAYIGSREKVCRDRTADAEAVPASISSEAFVSAIERHSTRKFTLSLRSGSLSFGDKTCIMGILNITPDSFSDGGRFHGFDAAVAQGEKMAEEGADILDIGGESTRPGSDPVPLEEESERVLPVVEYLSKNLRIPISIDTCKAEIARRALDAGAEIVNDVSALRFDPEMAGVVRENGCPLILMHMLGSPKVMQESPHYDALMPEIIAFLAKRIDAAIEEGISFEQLIVDPGIGFGKTVDHNLEILRDLSRMRALGRPILIGSSRKSTIGVILDAEPHDRLEGSAATVAVAIAHGAHIVRVHDVRQMARVARMTDAIMGKKWK